MTFFSNLTEELFQEASAKLKKELSLADATASAKGYLRSGRLWEIREKIFIDNVANYSNVLLDNLTLYENEYSPIDTNDFDFAKKTLLDFILHSENIYEELRNNKHSTYPKTRPPFGGGKMERAKNIALHSFEGKKLEFKSKRSFLKWAIGDAKKRAWSFILILVGGLLVKILDWAWPIIQNISS